MKLQTLVLYPQDRRRPEKPKWMNNGAFELYWEVGISEWEISTGTPVEVGILNGKVGGSHQPRVVNERWLSRL